MKINNLNLKRSRFNMFMLFRDNKRHDITNLFSLQDLNTRRPNATFIAILFECLTFTFGHWR